MNRPVNTAPSHLVIEANSLSKRYGERLVVDGFSVRVERGQIFGLLGPNAAGKTTSIRMLCGIIEPDAGEISINGTGVTDAKSQIGYVAQAFGQYEELTVRENLEFYAEMYGVRNPARLDQLLKCYSLQRFSNQHAGNLSGGYQRRLGLACAVAHDPDVLFLDEPTAGIDPVTRKLLWDEFYELGARGKTLFVTTHYMEEAQRCHQLAFIDQGKIIARGTPLTIRESLGGARVFSSEFDFDPEAQRALQALDGVRLVNQFGHELRIVVAENCSQDRLEEVLSKFANAPVSLTIDTPNLEDVFIALTQHEEPRA